MTRDPSRWWYALLPLPILIGVRSVFVGLMKLLLPTAGPTPAEALPVLLMGIGASLVGALVVVSVPLFTAGVLLDIRALRTRSSWTPHWGYGALGVLPVPGIFVEWFALVSIPAVIGYLELRRRSVGHPIGRGQPTDRGTTTAADQSSARTSPSRWWYGVVVPPVLELAGQFVVWTVRTTGLLRRGSDPLALLVPMALILVGVGFVPVFAISLYRDAKAVREVSGDTILDPRIWGVLGLGSLVGLVLFRITFMPVIALAYVLGRHLADGP